MHAKMKSSYTGKEIYQEIDYRRSIGFLINFCKSSTHACLLICSIHALCVSISLLSLHKRHLDHLVNQLVKAMLTICSWLAKVNFTSCKRQWHTINGYALAITFHANLNCSKEGIRTFSDQLPEIPCKQIALVHMPVECVGQTSPGPGNRVKWPGGIPKASVLLKVQQKRYLKM